MNTCDVEEGSTVAVFGLGAVGLAALQVGERLGDVARAAAMCLGPAHLCLWWLVQESRAPASRRFFVVGFCAKEVGVICLEVLCDERYPNKV